MEQLIEQACDLYDWIALLWAACGEAPGKEWLANVNYRRALSSISDCRNLSWTTVILGIYNRAILNIDVHLELRST